ncbi:MAG: penicillin-binding protein 2 [Actinomycetota bacterium]
MTDPKLGRRMTALAAVIAFAFAALVTRLWFLQVLAAEQYRERAEGNFVRLIPVPSARGRILDRNGQALVENKSAVAITIDRQEVKNVEETLFRLSQLLEVPVEELTRRYNDPDFLPFQPVPVYVGAPEIVALYIREHSEDFPGVDYQEMAVREYVHSDLAAHLLGYLGEISPQELRDPSFSDHRPGQLVGRGGVEQAYERYLRGEDGWLKQEVDAGGELQGRLGFEDGKPGNDLVLAIDGEIQTLAQSTLQEAVSAARTIVDSESGTYLKATGGAVVVMDPNDGHVLALASLPSYDPAIFLDGLTQQEFDALKRPSANFPLSNRAIAGQYPPGSTFKPFVAATAVRGGYAETSGFYPCPAEFVVPGDTSGTVFHNWKESSAGTISFAESLIQSCDTVFYKFGLDFWADRQGRGDFMQHELRKWGFGDLTGIDIPGETQGRVPDARWKQTVHTQYPDLFPEPTWLPGDNINMSIGQGDLLLTPLQLATAYSAIANGGTLYRPQVALRVQRPDGTVIRRFEGERTGKVPATRGTLAAIANALRGVVSSGSGTATAAFAGFPLDEHPVAGKTGTSEVAGKQPDSWFAAFAPADAPEFVVVAVVEQGGHGSQVAAPIVRRIMEGLLDLEPGAFQISEGATD